MPRISSFRGVTIRMFFNEDFHPGRPHFHAEYAGMVKLWAGEHEVELMANWERARNHQPLEPIDPLR